MLLAIIPNRQTLSVRGRGKDHAHSCSTSDLTLNLDRAAGLFDNAATDGQTESGTFALWLGGKEWFPDFLEVFGGDAFTGVREFNGHRFRSLQPGRLGADD